jgi:antirestriction protein ArdC
MDVYSMVTDKILELLGQGHIPWKKPWQSTGGAKNLVSKKHYNGINQFLLNCSPYSSPYWLTYKQAADKGGHIRKGEKSTLVVFWKFINTTTDTPTSEEISQDTPTRIKQIPILRYYNVFNMDQVEGIKPPAPEIIISPFTAIERAEQIIDQMPNRPDIYHEGDQASYSPAYDRVTMPPRERFTSAEGYYGTLFHELSHATGHQTRLNRKGIIDPIRFASKDYSQEELVAEFSSAMLCNLAGIEQETITNSAAYIQNWLKALRDDKKLAIIAAGQAQKACNLIIGKKEDNDPEITD